jgi:AmmeMemoRadiSam system protein B
MPAMPRTDNERYPQLRPLDVRRHERNGQRYIALRDPLSLSENTLLVPQALAAVLAFCDGEHDAMEMATMFCSEYGVPIEVAVVEELLTALDENFLLENQRSAAAIARVLDEFRQAPARPALLAGRGYPEDPAELHAFLNDYLENASSTPKPRSEWPQWAGLLSPHIDYHRGGAVYAELWKHVGEAVRAADLVILFGTDHYGDDPISLTRQSYATPYGVLPTAQGLVDELVDLLGEEAAFAGELRHRDEHSLELVAVWLHHMRNGKPVEVVPILTGSFQRFMHNGFGPADDDRLTQLLDRLRSAAGDRRVLVVASGDLAHAGSEFGGPPLDDDARRVLLQADETLLDTLRGGDAESFYGAIRQVKNANNVCGLSPIYLTLRLLENGQEHSPRGEQLGYAVCPADPHDTSVVTIAGMTFLP